ncbi:TRP-domain-containing protein [Aspergillus homomorphus CBS 101889]|uniref:TRP-domain-containing protein n=1 Tax=Aspergillus homomorphus (strain CBS 101889) TaxID=1450537 RepID=A0A395HLH7_ASPHC|nr:TRP-domain-containing protein [Aspergillus homomorphus CBS 101889]RAL08792.1 TRP-domain-containing protein [Aspergillus homomorphus CBS 101889]
MKLMLWLTRCLVRSLLLIFLDVRIQSTRREYQPVRFRGGKPLSLTIDSLEIKDTPLTISGFSVIPGIAYTAPDLDATVRVKLMTLNGSQISCVKTDVDNGKTVDQAGVGWVLAVATGFGLLASAVIAILGQPGIATHVSFRARLLLSFMQSQAIAGMSSISFPPIV